MCFKKEHTCLWVLLHFTSKHILYTALVMDAYLLICVACCSFHCMGFYRCLLVCFVCCSCHGGFADACYCVLHAALAIRALQMLIQLFCMLVLPSRFCRCLLICFAYCPCHQGFEYACHFVLHTALAFRALQMLSGLCGMLLVHWDFAEAYWFVSKAI